MCCCHDFQLVLPTEELIPKTGYGHVCNNAEQFIKSSPLADVNQVSIETVYFSSIQKYMWRVLNWKLLIQRRTLSWILP